MSDTITSPQNPRIKFAIRLRDGGERRRERRIVIEGARELGRAIEGSVTLVETFVCEPFCQSDAARAVLEQARPVTRDLWQVTPQVFARLAYRERSDGLVAIGEMPHATLDLLPDCKNPLVAVLVGIEKPGNLGAVLRTADGAGVSAVVVADPKTDFYNPNCIRASLGTVFTLPVASAKSAEALAWLRERRIAIHAARVDTVGLYTSMDFTGPAAIVLGDEATGLSAAWRADDITPIRLPMLGRGDSLNVSAAAAALFYEARRQRDLASGGG